MGFRLDVGIECIFVVLRVSTNFLLGRGFTPVPEQVSPIPDHNETAVAWV